MTPTLLERIAPLVERTYHLERELGRGATAAVFLAHDQKHDRSVALKLLLPDIAASIGVERFLREIRLAARLAHPHILPLLDSGAVDGLPFYVMPFVEGETLRELLQRERRLEVETAIGLVYEVADALEYAHAAGIIHRDVKPENILLLGAHAVLADFGIARAMFAATDQSITGLGLAVGTPAYMSPEQAAGEEQIDGRCDQYALASVLFEMLTGEPPFRGATAQATIAKRLMGPAPHLRDLRPELAESLDSAVACALAIDPTDRFPGVLGFAAALSGHGDARPSRKTMAPAGKTYSAVRALRHQTIGDMPSIAVLPFENASSDPDMEFFSDGVTDEIIGALSRVRNLRVAARSSCYALRHQAMDVRALGERLGVSAVLDGSVRRAGPRVRVSAHLVDARSGYQLWAEQFDRELHDVFAIQDEISRHIVETLKVRLLADAARLLGTSTTTNTLAHDAYLRGRYHLNRRTEEGIRASLDFFNEAIDNDADYAAAFIGRADCLALMALYGMRAPVEVMPQARDAAEEALRRDPSLAEAYVTLGTVRALHDWDWTGADEAFRRSVALSPRYAAAHQRYAMDCLTPRGLFTAALDEIEQACALEPISSVMRSSAGIVRYFAGDAAGARANQRSAAEIDPAFAMADFFLGTIERDGGDPVAALAAFNRAISQTGGTPEMRGGLAQTHAKLGAIVEATRLRNALESEAASRWVSPCVFVQVDLALGRRESALDWLDRAEKARDPELAYLAVRPVYAALHGESRFDLLVRRIASR